MQRPALSRRDVLGLRGNKKTTKQKQKYIPKNDYPTADPIQRPALSGGDVLGLRGQKQKNKKENASTKHPESKRIPSKCQLLVGERFSGGLRQTQKHRTKNKFQNNPNSKRIPSQLQLLVRGEVFWRPKA